MREKSDYPFVGGKRLQSITQNHVPLVWECLLGTVYARNPETSEINYFDYDLKAAREFAKVSEAKDLRISRVKDAYNWSGYTHSPECSSPRKNQLVLWGVHPKMVWKYEHPGEKNKRKMVYNLIKEKNA